jgi:hypothetical protein
MLNVYKNNEDIIYLEQYKLTPETIHTLSNKYLLNVNYNLDSMYFKDLCHTDTCFALKTKQGSIVTFGKNNYYSNKKMLFVDSLTNFCSNSYLFCGITDNNILVSWGNHLKKTIFPIIINDSSNAILRPYDTFFTCHVPSISTIYFWNNDKTYKIEENVEHFETFGKWNIIKKKNNNNFVFFKNEQLQLHEKLYTDKDTLIASFFRELLKNKTYLFSIIASVLVNRLKQQR